MSEEDITNNELLEAITSEFSDFRDDIQELHEKVGEVKGELSAHKEDTSAHIYEGKGKVFAGLIATMVVILEVIATIM